MLGLGLVSTWLGGGGPTKEEKKETEMKAAAQREQRAREESDLEGKKRAFDADGDGTNRDSKENKPKDNSQPDDDGLITRKQFLSLESRFLKRKDEAILGEAATDGHKRFIQRRWAVRLWNLQVESLLREDCTVFINIDFGGDREESRIRTGEGIRWWQVLGDPEVVWGVGDDPLSLRSDVMELKEKAKISFDNEFKFEWRGSYADLESQQMVVELWRWSRFRANTLDSSHKATLHSYATGPVFQDINLVRANVARVDGFVSDEKDEAPRFRVTFQLYYQEIYDFELNIIDVQAFGLLPESTLNQAHTSEFFKPSKKFSRAATLGLLPNGGAVEDQTTAIDSIQDPSDSDDSNGEEPASGRRRQTINPLYRQASRRAVKRLSIGLAHVAGVHRKKIQGPESNIKLKRRVTMEIRNRSIGSSLMRGSMFVKSQMKKVEKGNSSLDRWGNIGRIHYRGTWADLDNDLLKVKFFESQGLDPVSSLIAEASVSLRGVAEYGTISAACSAPSWVIRRAKTDAKEIRKAAVGRFEAKISVENQPKYKQSGELCDMINEKAYLLVRVIRVDRLALPDQRPISQCDSAVQVQFSGNSYETEVRQDTISPQFNQEFYFELKTNTPAEFSPEELASIHGPVILDVWLRSDDEGALSAEHCGHVEVSLPEIFAEGKPEMKSHTSIRTGEVSEYRTVVLKARRRLKCLWTDAGPNVNVPASAALPSYIYVDIWLRPFDFTVFGGGPSKVLSVNGESYTSSSSASVAASRDPLLPARVRSEWTSRANEWEDIAHSLRGKSWTAPNRNFNYIAKSQNRDEHFLPLFLDVIRPPESIANASAIAFWVHCLSHTTIQELKAASPFWATPDFCLSLGKGDTFAHAILHCSMLRGLPTGRSFVCVGTGWDAEPLAWVMTLNEDGSVVFWDTAAHRQFRLPRRVADTTRCGRVVSGKRSVGTQISADLEEAEKLRRRRLAQQEVYLSKLSKMQTDLIDCDEEILRSPEILKVMDPNVHPHALMFTSCWDKKWVCSSCSKPPPRNCLQGFVCNRSAPECEFRLCLKCADKCFPPSAAEREVQDTARFSVQPILPYKTIDVIFDHTNCWLNLQHFCPTSVLYDLWNPTYWFPFTTVLTTFRSFSLASKGLRKAKTSEYFENIRSKIITRVQRGIESVRRNGNAPSFFQKDSLLISHVEKGLELNFKRELVDQESPTRRRIEAELERWKLELYSKVPSNHRFIGHTFLFSFTDSLEITRIVLDKIDFLAMTFVGTQFVLACYTGKLPNSVNAVFVYLGVTYPMSEEDLKNIVEERNKNASSLSIANAFTDEVIERNKRFSLTTQVFESDTDFISRMRADLYNKSSGGASASSDVVTFKLSANSARAPNRKDSSHLKSRVDYAGDDEDEDSNEEETDNLLSVPSSDVVMPAPATFSNPFSRLTEALQIPTAESAQPFMDSAAAMFDSLFSKPVQAEKPVASAPTVAAPQVHHPSAETEQLLARRGPITSPFAQESAVAPTEDELREIYKPYTVRRVVSSKKYLRHIETGYLIPLPPQEPLRRAVELGAGNLTTQVEIPTSQSSTVTRKVAQAPKEVVYDFNMQFTSAKK